VAEKRRLTMPDEILRAALGKETAARDFYSEMAGHCPVDFVRDLLERLKDEECKHMRLVQDMMARLAQGKRVP
jgi:rubrerythrin